MASDPRLQALRNWQDRQTDRLRIGNPYGVGTIRVDYQTFQRLVPHLPFSYQCRAEDELSRYENSDIWMPASAITRPVMLNVDMFEIWMRNIPVIQEVLERARIRYELGCPLRGPNGQILVDDESGRMEQSLKLVRESPGKVLFAVPKEKQLEPLAYRLQAALNETVERLRGPEEWGTSRIAVSTFPAAKRVNWHVYRIVFPYWHGGIADSAFPIVCDSHAQSIVVIHTPYDQLDWEDLQDLDTFVGPVIENLCRPRPEVLTHSFAPFGGHRRPQAEGQGHDRRSKYYDRHNARNRFVASLANELITEFSRPASLNRLVLLAATTEHSRKLAGRLPNWPVLSARSRPPNLPPHSIVTLPAAHEMHERRIFTPSDLIVAMGGLPGTWFEGYLNDRQRGSLPLRLIDLTDEFCDEASQWGLARKQMYKSAGSHFRPLCRELVKRAKKAARRKGPATSSTSSPEV